MKTHALAALAALTVASIAAADLVDIDVDGIQSWDGQGDDSNETLVIDLASAIGLAPGSDVVIDGVGWDVTIESQGASWMSEAIVGFDDTVDDVLFLTPGFGADEPGTQAFSSGGIIRLEDTSIGNITIVGGVIGVEFFESFDDEADVVDAGWSGTLQLSVVPAPGALALLGAAGLAGTRRHRG